MYPDTDKIHTCWKTLFEEANSGHELGVADVVRNSRFLKGTEIVRGIILFL